MVKIRLPYRKIFFGLFLTLAVILLIRAGGDKIINSGYFNIKRIIIRGSAEVLPPRQFLGRNLLTLNLADLKKKLCFEYPQLRDIIVSRVFPQTLVINACARIPIAKLGAVSKAAASSFYVDRELVALDLAYDKEYANLPEITGLKINPRAGRKIQDKPLNTAAAILEAHRGTGSSKIYLIESIDVSKLSSAFFNITVVKPEKEGGLTAVSGNNRVKVIIGKEQIKEKMRTLYSLLSKIGPALDRIGYIDLRFKDPVTGDN